MTIICVDANGFMAADGQVSCDGIIVTRTAKKIITTKGSNGPALCALTGTTLFEGPVVRWYENGANPHDAPKGDKDYEWHLVVVDRAGVWKYDWDTPYPDSFPTPWAWGRNRELAIGLMLAGKTAPEAVAILCEKTTGAGGEIQVVNIAEAIGIMKEAAE